MIARLRRWRRRGTETWLQLHGSTADRPYPILYDLMYRDRRGRWWGRIR